MNVLQWHRIHTPSLFWSVTHHNLPVLFESCILYLHLCTCFAQTPQIKRSTVSCCSARITVRVQAVPELDKNKAFLNVIFRKLIPRRNLVINYNPKHNVWFKIQVKINTVMHGSRSFGALLWAAVSSNWTILFVYYKKKSKRQWDLHCREEIRRQRRCKARWM